MWTVKGEKNEFLTDIVFVTELISTVFIKSQAVYGHVQFKLKSSIDSFAYINKHEFESAVRNLIKNAAEAINESGGGLISIELDSWNEYVRLTISDNGTGIPPETFNSPKFFTKGLTTKKGGSGIGIPHAKRTVESCGGKFDIESNRDGTTIRLLVPSALRPPWFTSQIVVKIGMEVIHLDDDAEQRLRVKIRFDKFKDKMKLLSFSKAEELYDFVKTNKQSNRIFLIDQHVQYEKKGIEIIQELKIAEASTLITDANDDQHLQNMAIRLGVKILPKTILADADIVWV
jgi:anti-sigma regulatory factor (Ser/Thr protein kinase)